MDSKHPLGVILANRARTRGGQEEQLAWAQRSNGDWRDWTQDSKPILWHALTVGEGAQFHILASGASQNCPATAGQCVTFNPHLWEDQSWSLFCRPLMAVLWTSFALAGSYL